MGTFTSGCKKYMDLRRLLRQLCLFYKIFLVPPKDWRRPKVCDVLIYNAVNVMEALGPYLKNRNVTVLSTKGESINVLCFIQAITRRSFWKGRAMLAYSEAFVEATKPKLILNFIDNDKNFYYLSKSTGVPTVFIQNGIRMKQTDIFTLTDLIATQNNRVDYMLVFGSAVGRKYKSMLSGETIVIGSLINNQINKSMDKDSSSVVFISTYRARKKNNAPFIPAGDDGIPVSYDSFYLSEQKSLKFLAKWCAENHKSLKIAGCGQKGGDDNETDFYASILAPHSYTFVPRLSNNYSYRLIDSAEIVVCVDSTLGFESIARKNKTAFFSRGQIKVKSLKFGWPAELPDNGPFWTNKQDEKEFKRIMDYLCIVSDQEFEQTWQQYASEVMDYDPGNTRLIALLDRLLS